MTENANLPALWQAELDTLAAQSPNWFVRLLPPRLIVKYGRFSPPWLPPAWLNNRPGAWTFWCYVIVSEAVLDCPTPCRRYLLSHEYGHLHALHQLRALSALALIAVAHFLSIWGQNTGISPMWVVMIAGLSFFVGCFGFIMFIRAYGVTAESQADAFAVRICDRQTVIEGMLWLSRLSGRGVTYTLRKRLKKLGHFV